MHGVFMKVNRWMTVPMLRAGLGPWLGPPAGGWRVFGAQSTGCSPIATAYAAGNDTVQPVKPTGIAKSLNIGNPAEFTIRQLADLAIEVTGSSSPIVHEPLPPDDPTQRQPDLTLAGERLGWEPTVRFHALIKMMVEADLAHLA